MSDYKKFVFKEVDELREMKQHSGEKNPSSSAQPRDGKNVPNSSTVGTSRRVTKSGLSNRPVGEGPW